MKMLAWTLCALLVAGCNLNVDQFDVDASGSTTIQGSGIVGALLGSVGFGGSFGNYDIASSSEFQNQGAKKEDIRSAKLRSMKLTVTSGDSFEKFLDAISFFAETDGQPRVRIATKTGIDLLPDNTTVLNLDIDNVELQPYITAPSMKITTEATGTAPTQDTTINADAVFRIDLTLL